MTHPGADNDPAPGADPIDVSIIVPTLNEAGNLPELARRVSGAMRGRSYELLVIDDASADDTSAVCAALARDYPLTLHVRPDRHGGLSGAVLYGMKLARGRALAVMDADLQHPPERLSALVEPLLAESSGADDGPDFVLGSRYIAGGSTADRWGPMRRLNSVVATWLARPFAGKTRDPMSGFFALRRATFERARSLTPLGYKIGLELMCKCRVRSVLELPIHFDLRAHGRSKLTLREQFRYLEHLSRLYDFYYPQASPIAKFLIVLWLSWLAAGWTFDLLTRLLGPGLGPAGAVALSYPAAIAATAIFHLRYVRTQREFLVSRHPWLSFWIISAGEWAACAAAAFYLASGAHRPSMAELFIIPFGCAAVARYALRKEFRLDIRGLRRQPGTGE